ncbi:MAG: PKD domain-containing protein, partial [Blastocatellia bacterium]
GGGGGGGGANGAPVARVAPIPAQVQATLKQGAVIRLDGSASSDPDNDSLSYKWYDNGAQIAEGAIIDVTLAAGLHTVTLKVSDSKGGENTSAPQNVEVLPRPLSILSASPAKIDNFGYTTITVRGTGFNSETQVRFDCTSFCQGGSQIAITINSIEEDAIVLTARTTQKTPFGNRDCIVTGSGGATSRLVRSNFVSN